MSDIICLLLRLLNLQCLPLSTVNVFKSGDFIPGLQSLTVPSPEQDRSCILVLCIDNPQTASVWAIIVSCNTFESEK